MILRPSGYIDYIRQHKQPSPRTIETYERTLRAIGIAEVDTENMESVWQTLLEGMRNKDAEGKSKFGYVDVERFISILSAWAKKNDSKARLDKRLTYNKLRDTIRLIKSKINRQAYSDDELETIFKHVRRETFAYNGLYHLCLLLLYSGMRVGGAYNIKWEDVSKIDGYPQVVTFPAVSKGQQYWAICRRDVIDYIKANSRSSPTIIYYDELNTTRFDVLYRKQMLRALSKAWIETDNHSVFHSFRKTFAQKLLTNPDIEPKSISYQYLMGHVPKDTTAIKFYVLPNSIKIPYDLVRRCAHVYSNSELMRMSIGLEEKEVRE